VSKLQPQIKEIRFGTEEHRQVLEAVRQRRKMSFDGMSTRYGAWSDMEERFRAYIKPTAGDLKRTDQKRDGKPSYVTLVVPYDYAILLTLHTYITAVFLGRNPVFQYDGRHGETSAQVDAVEAIINYQQMVGEWLVPLYIWLMDGPKYGIGILGSQWVDESVVTTESAREPVSYFGINTGRTRDVRRTIRIPGYSGHRLFNVRPQDWFPDPRVSISRFQEGEFCGRRANVGWNTIIRRQQQGVYYNIDALKANSVMKDSNLRDRGSSQLVLPDEMETWYVSPGQGTDKSKDIKNNIDLFELEVELIPKTWKLGTSDSPEKWVITVANEAVIVSAEPLGLYHDKFTFDVIEHEVEGYALSKRSLLEVLAPMNDTLSWLFNSHMHNVRKVMNDNLIIDPSGVVVKDFTDPLAGRLIRLKPEAYGKDARAYVHQLQVTDVTQNHLRDSQLVMEMMQRIVGVVENAMGQQSRGGRQTATESRITSNFSVNRMKTNAEYYSAMGFTPLSMKLLQTTQQKYKGDKVFRIAGDLMNTKQPIKVTAADIAGFYDFVPVDGTLPVDRFAQAMVWKEIFGIVAAGRVPMPGLDMMGLLKHIAFLSGAKDFSQFQVQVQNQNSINQQVQSGNLVALPGGKGGSPTGADSGAAGGGTPGATVQVPQSGGSSGVGRAG
jgi:hypothetical protein